MRPAAYQTFEGELPRGCNAIACRNQAKVTILVAALNDPITLIEPITAIRHLIERVQLIPEDGEL